MAATRHRVYRRLVRRRRALEQVDVRFCASVKKPRAVTTRRDMIGTTAWSWQGIFAAAVRGAAERPPELVVNS
jgi:hypothetical protein